MAITPTASLDTRGTGSLIGSDKVEGTPVYRSNGEKVGRIERVMVDKISGKVAYAVMSFGGFMGIGEDYYPLPWSVLTYNPRLDGYEVNITEPQLKAAPKCSTRPGTGPIVRAARKSTTITAPTRTGADLVPAKTTARAGCLRARAARERG